LNSIGTNELSSMALLKGTKEPIGIKKLQTPMNDG
jgi:hypothetical protein